MLNLILRISQDIVCRAAWPPVSESQSVRRFMAGTDDVSVSFRYLCIAVLVILTVAISLYPEIALAKIDDAAKATDGIKYIPKLIKDFMSEGGTALLAIGGGGIAIARASMGGLSVPAVAGAGGVGLAAGYGVGTVVSLSGAAIF